MISVSRLCLPRFLGAFSRLHHHSTTERAWQYEELVSRSFIKAQGRDSKELLQGLTTNDLNCLDKKCAVIYSMILNVKGRVLYDVLIYRLTPDDSGDPGYLIECDASIAPDLLKHLKMYKLRKKATVSNESETLKAWALLPEHDSDLLPGDASSGDSCRPSVTGDFAGEVVCVAADPRLRCWSARLILPTGVDAGSVVQGCSPALPGSYTSVRYDLGIGEGVLDHPPGSCLPLECNGALLNGVSFSKGCYLGQELTARTHHTGVVRKRLMPIRLTEEKTCAPDSLVVNDAGQQVGRLRGLVAGRGVALLRLSALTSARVTVRCGESGEEVPGLTHIPPWWPAEVGVKLDGDTNSQASPS